MENAVAVNRSYAALRRQISSAWVSRMGTKIVNPEVLPEILRPFPRDRSLPKPNVADMPMPGPTLGLVKPFPGMQ